MPKSRSGKGCGSTIHGIQKSLSYDILQTPHHCSWHSLSYDSWSEKGEDAEICRDALDALSQARGGATIIASSNPIKDDDNDPPCIRAKTRIRRYRGQRKGHVPMRRGAPLREVSWRYGV